MLLMEKPAEAARLCGLTRLTDTLHGRWIREMVFGQGDMTLLAHRGSYKTTCLSFAMAVMLVVYPRKNLLFLRKTDSDVLEVLRQVKLLLATDAMQELTGRIYGSPVQVLRGDMWSVNTDCYAAIRGAPQLLGLGTGGSMTGKHADIILTDDIVNLQDRISAVERKRICGVYQELQNIRNPGGRILNTGTPWHPDDAFRLMPPPEKYDCYQTGLLTKDAIAKLPAAMSARERKTSSATASAAASCSASSRSRTNFCSPKAFRCRRKRKNVSARISTTFSPAWANAPCCTGSATATGMPTIWKSSRWRGRRAAASSPCWTK